MILSPDQVELLTARPSAAWFPYTYRHGPNESGLYLLWGEDDSLLYVGRATSIRDRLCAHWRAGAIPFASVSYHFLPAEHCARAEAAHIEALTPPYNRKIERGAPAALVEHVRAAWFTALAPC